MDIFWMSNAPWVPSGYGQQTMEFTPRLKELGHNVGILAFYGLEGAMWDWRGLPVYPSDHTKLGLDLLPYYVGHFAGEVCGGADPADVQVISLYDVWPYIGQMEKLKGLRLASWVPVDGDPAPPFISEYFDGTGARPIAMSRFGEDRIRDVGLDPLYVPHGVDTKVLRPLDNRDEVRAGIGIPDGAFVVGMVANNQGNSPPRKSFPQVFAAFAEFRRRHEDAFLYLHSDMNGYRGGVRLKYLADSLGIPETAYGYTEQILLHVATLHTDAMQYVYGAMDVLANPSIGEGFGIPIVEAQACGVPVVVTDWTSMPELCGAGWLVDGDPWFNTRDGNYWKVPAVASILDAFEDAYAARDDQALRARAREFALGYDVDKVLTDYWQPALEALDAPREVPALNRAQRRAVARAAR